jgi:hypothetical protein
VSGFEPLSRRGRGGVGRFFARTDGTLEINGEGVDYRIGNVGLRPWVATGRPSRPGEGLGRRETAVGDDYILGVHPPESGSPKRSP